METPWTSSERTPEADVLRHCVGGRETWAFADLPLDMPLEQHGIVLRRMDQQTSTNVPHLVIHHSPTGYAWGYGGSGHADLARNRFEAAMLIDLIQSTVDPQSWQANGGAATIAYHPLTRSLVIKQTAEFHGKLSGMLP